MNKLFLTLSFFISFIYLTSQSWALVKSGNYTILLEEDGNSVAFIIRPDYSKQYGKIIQFGGYKWFRETFKNSSKNVISYIQPSHLGKSGDMKSYMIERYIVEDLTFEFSSENNNEILKFKSSRIFQEIEGYVSRNESFSLSAKSPKTWYAGTFLPIKNINDLKFMIKKNPKTFCQMVKDPIINSYDNKELGRINFFEFIQSQEIVCSSIVDKDTSTSSSNSKLDEYKTFCSEIGFTPGTEKFGDCVLEAMKKG